MKRKILEANKINHRGEKKTDNLMLLVVSDFAHDNFGTRLKQDSWNESGSND